MSVALTEPVRYELLSHFIEEDTESPKKVQGYMAELSNAGVRVPSIKLHTWQELTQGQPRPR